MSVEAADRVENCVFCNIIKADDPNIILEKNDDFVVINDIKPVSSHHILVLSHKHIQSAKSLKPCQQDRDLLENMVSAAKNTCINSGYDLNDTRIGFHWPPFYTVGHLHLHAIAPIKSMSIFNRYIAFNPSLNYVFVDVDYVQKRIKSDENNGTPTE